MRAAVLIGLLLLPIAAVTQESQNVPPPGKGPEGTLTLHIDSQSQKATLPPFVEYAGAVSELVRAVIWPLFLGLLVVTQRKPLGRLLDALVELIQHSNRIKLGGMIDVEVDRSARQAEKRDLTAAEVPLEEIEAAARVGRIAEQTDVSTIRVRMLEFAREYEGTRSNMKPGTERTRAMNAIMAKMRTLGMAATPLLQELANDKTSPGRRLAALAILQLAPDLAYVDWIVERMKVEQPFLLFHASLALLAMVRNYGAQERDELEGAVERSLDIVQSFAGGTPDRNTVGILQLAKTEIGRSETR